MSLPLVAAGVTVFRMVPTTATFVPPGNKPPPESFRPTDDDVVEANERKFELPLASVWDLAQSSVKDVKALRPKPARAFAVEVDTVRRFKVPELLSPEVYSDPCDPNPGVGVGHCGISGFRALEETPETKKLKNAFKALRALVAGAAYELTE